jgi:hypothetical protein
MPKFHPVTRVICGAFSVLAAIGTTLMALSTPVFEAEGAKVFLMCASLALLTGYFASVGEIPRTWLWAIVASPLILLSLLALVFFPVLFTRDLVSGAIEPFWLWIAAVFFFWPRSSRTVPAEPSDPADGEPRAR